MIEKLTIEERDEIARMAGDYQVHNEGWDGVAALITRILKIGLYCFIQATKEGAK